MAQRGLNQVGWSRAQIAGRMHEFADEDRAALDEVNFRRRFFGGSILCEVAAEAYGAFAHTPRGAIYPGFPEPKSVAFMQKEVIDHSLELLQAPSDGAGLVTYGGTESIIMAAKSAVTQAGAHGIPRHEMEIVTSSAAHPCIDKAAELLGVRLRRVRVGRDWRADPEGFAAAISSRTVMIVAAYPSYAYGLGDDIQALGRLALDRDIWLHVDACMSGLLAPFIKLSGEHVAPFDFSVDGVCSISADLHKHGYSAKGASLILFRSEKLVSYAQFEYTNHPLPPMRTRTLAGTAAGAPIASAWAIMKYLGVDGYTSLAADLVRTRHAFVNAIRAVPGFDILGDPAFSIVVVTSSVHDMRRVRERLTAHQWFTLPVSDPAGIHLNLSACDERLAAPFARELVHYQE